MGYKTGIPQIMKTKLLIAAIVLISALTVSAQTTNYFPNLLKVTIGNYSSIYFGYDKASSRLINKPGNLSSLNDPSFRSNPLSEEFIVAKYKNPGLKDSLIILYNEGLSADPTFVVYNSNHELLGEFLAREFYINSSGTIYTSSHTNNSYNRRCKFQLQNDSIIEVKQPYYYVGLKDKTLKNITLYKDKEGTEVVAQLPKDYEIEILLAEPDTQDYKAIECFLVRTEFGLVGWLRVENIGMMGTVLKGLFYAGD